MAWRSPGTGSPISFRCAKCRRHSRYPELGRIQHVILTGKFRPNRRIVGRLSTSPRNRAWSIEYICQDCNHPGWSSHAEIVRRFEREHRGGEPLPLTPD